MEQDFDTITTRVARGRITELRLLLWAALRPYHGEAFPTPESVAGLIDTYTVPATRALLRALLLLNVNDDPPTDDQGKAIPDDRPGSIWRRLYLDVRCFGLSAETFWNLSLLELWREMAAARQYADAERKRSLTQAWWMAALTWSKKLPELSTLIDAPSKRAARQTWQDMKAHMQHFADAQQKGAA